MDVHGLVGDFGRGAAHDTGEGLDAVVVADHHILGGQRALDVVEGLECLAGSRIVHAQAAGDCVGVEGVHGLAGKQHDVVRHVGRGVDGAHTRKHEFALHPERRGGIRVDPLDRAHAKALRPRGFLNGDRNGLLLRLWDFRNVDARDGRVLRDVGELEVEGGRDLPGQPASRECVPTVRGHVDVEDGVVRAEDLPGVVTRRRRAAVERNNAFTLGGQAELCRGSHHAVRDVVVRLARGDLEATGQHRARERDDDKVTLGEIPGAADDALRLPGPVGVADIHLAVADGLLKPGELLDLYNAANNERALNFG